MLGNKAIPGIRVTGNVGFKIPRTTANRPQPVNQYKTNTTHDRVHAKMIPEEQMCFIDVLMGYKASVNFFGICFHFQSKKKLNNWSYSVHNVTYY